jgi:hypothetical protein
MSSILLPTSVLTSSCKVRQAPRANLGRALHSLFCREESDGPFFVDQVPAAILTGGCASSNEFDNLLRGERWVEGK